MKPLAAVQQAVYEVYIALCQRSPVSRIDVIKLRRLVHECESVNSAVKRLRPETVDEMYNRSLKAGNPKLEFEGFEKAVIMLSMLTFPKLHASAAYSIFVQDVLVHTACMSGSQFSKLDCAKMACMAELVMEKRDACVFEVPLYSFNPNRSPRSQRAHSQDSLDAPRSPISPDSLPKQCSSVRKMPLESRASVPPQLGPSPVFDSLTEAGSESTLFPSMLNVATDASRPSLSPTSGFPPTKSSSLHRWGKQAIPPSVAPKHPLSPSRPSAPLVRPTSEASIAHSGKQLEKALVSQFGSLELAFARMDASAGFRTNRVSLPKFRHCCNEVGFEGDVRAVFKLMDVKGDGVIDLEELVSWKTSRHCM